MKNKVVPERLRILIAEDNTANSHMLITMLRSLGCSPDHVEDGHAALEILAREPYDLVLMDCEMPGLNGDEVTKELRTHRELYASQPLVVAVTATNSAEHRQRCLESGMNGFIAKPIRLRELKKVIGQWALMESEGQAADIESAGQLTARTDELASRVHEQLYSRIGRDNTENMGTYIDLFLSDSAKRIQDLHGALLANDTEMLSRQSHALKGACSEIGHLRMSQYCDDLRAASEQGKLDDASPIVDVLEEEFGRLRKILEAEKGNDAGIH
jgi:CheY-like chemotaxis protein